MEAVFGFEVTNDVKGIARSLDLDFRLSSTQISDIKRYPDIRVCIVKSTSSSDLYHFCQTYYIKFSLFL